MYIDLHSRRLDFRNGSSYNDQSRGPSTFISILHVLLSIMLALMVTPERRDATQAMYAPIHPAQALLTRFTCWEKRIENLIEFFTQVQDFQRIHSRHYLALSVLASQTFGEAERFREDGVIRIWKGLQEKTAVLARFYDGLSTAYDETVLRDLKMKLAEIRIFKGDLNKIRSKEAARAEKKQGNFEVAVNNLTKSLNQIGVSKQRDDPFVANRSKPLWKAYLTAECRLHLEKWVRRDNELKARISDIHQRCANFELNLVPKIKEALSTYVSISQNEFQTAGEAFTELQGSIHRGEANILDITEAIDRGADWAHFQQHEPSLRGGNLQPVDPTKLTFSNWDHPFTSPLIAGAISEWKSFRRRWVKGYYCVTGTGYLMLFDHPLDQLVGNLTPRKSLNLKDALLGTINVEGRDAWFSIVSDKWREEEPSYGVKKYAKAPIKLAKHAISKLRTVKLQMSHKEAKRWHNTMAQFTSSRHPIAAGTGLRVCVFGGSKHTSDVPYLTGGDIEDVDEDEDEEATEDVQSSAASLNESVETGSDDDGEDAWEPQTYEADIEKFDTIADKQPGHITHNPW
jgi:hypothetical protein